MNEIIEKIKDRLKENKRLEQLESAKLALEDDYATDVSKQMERQWRNASISTYNVAILIVDQVAKEFEKQ